MEELERIYAFVRYGEVSQQKSLPQPKPGGPGERGLSATD